MVHSFKYELEFPLKVAVEGKDQEGVMVDVKSPRPRDGENCMVMEATFLKCIMKAASIIDNSKFNVSKKEEENEEENEEEKANGIIKMILMGAEDKDIRSLNNGLRDLLTEGNIESPQATIEGIKFTKPIFDELHYIDKKALLGRYISSFLSSALT